MITSLRLVNFKNFADETLRLGPFTVIVGANASGKSNIRDAFRFLHGIGRGYTLAEILGGKYGEGGQKEWDGIRGAPLEIARLQKVYVYDWSHFSVHLDLDSEGETLSYSIEIGFHPTAGFSVLEEKLSTDSGLVYATKDTDDRTTFSLLIGDSHEELKGISRLQPVLRQYLSKLSQNNSQLSVSDIQSHQSKAIRLLVAIVSIRFLELLPERMREPSLPGATVLTDSGQNLPTVLQGICSDKAQKDILTSWLQELTPMDVTDFQFPTDPNGRVFLQLVERDGRRVSAYSASDGTLRFLAMLTALLGANPAGAYFFEEIDNGIHPSRLHLLIELIENQTKSNGIQVITTTHSPEVLNLINDNTFENTSVVYRDEESSDAVIRPASDLPNANRLRKSKGLGRLHSTGWMEDMLAFAEADREAGE